MLGPRRKDILIQGMSRNIRAIRLKHITEPGRIQEILEYILQMRREGAIDSFEEIGTSSTELLSWLP